MKTVLLLTYDIVSAIQQLQQSAILSVNILLTRQIEGVASQYLSLVRWTLEGVLVLLIPSTILLTASSHNALASAYDSL